MTSISILESQPLHQGGKGPSKPLARPRLLPVEGGTREIENPGMFRLVMNVPEMIRDTITLRFFISSLAACAIPPSSSSLKPPRLLTRSTTSSLLSFLNGRKERSLSEVDMIRSSNCGIRSLKGGTGLIRLFPDSLWIPSPISISSADKWVSPVAVPGT